MDQDATEGVAKSLGIMLSDGGPISTAWSFALQLDMIFVGLIANAIVPSTAHVQGVRTNGVPEAQGSTLPPSSTKLALVDIHETKSLVLGK